MDYSKADIIWLLYQRSDNPSGIIHYDRDLWKLKHTMIFKKIDSPITEDENKNIINQRKLRLTYKYDRKYINEIFNLNNIKIGERSKDGLLDIIIYINNNLQDLIMPDELEKKIENKIPEIKLDEDQQKCIDKCLYDELYIHAGPGAGKTTTLCHLIKNRLKINPLDRILILVYNRQAEQMISDRLTNLGVRAIFKSKCFDEMTSGVLVLTFDKFGYQIMKYHGEKSKFSNYNKSFEHSAFIASTKGVPDVFNAIILDEAQDILPVHTKIIDSILNIPKKPDLIVAGDPRQEITQGATWFSYKWSIISDDKKMILRYNHRSTPEIVNAINTFSRENFPTLHYDQIPTRKSEDNNSVEIKFIDRSPSITGLDKDCEICMVNDRCGTNFINKRCKICNKRESWKFTNTTSDNLVGSITSEELNKYSNGFAISPVTCEKWKIERVVKTMRQKIYESNPGKSIIISTRENNIEPTSITAQGAYTIATSKKLKGTECENVVVFSSDVDYSLVIDPTNYKKLIYVALSRARDKLTVIWRPNGPELPKQIMMKFINTVIIMNPKIHDKNLIKEINEDNAPISLRPDISIPVTGSSKALSSMPSINYTIIEQDYLDAVLDIEIQNDPDFVGIYTEALIAQTSGAKMMRRENIYFEKVNKKQKKFEGIYTSIDSQGHMKITIRSKEEYISKIKKFIKDNKKLGIAYFNTVINYTINAGTLWTVSEHLEEENKQSIADATLFSSLIKELIDVDESVVPYYHNMSIYEIFADRNYNNNKIAGYIKYEPDLIYKNEFDEITDIIEIKAVKKINSSHRKQAAIYAALKKYEKCILINARDGEVEYIQAEDVKNIERTTRAIINTNFARSLSINTYSKTCLKPPYGISSECIISVDVETDNENNIIEIGAVATSNDWTILGVYKIIPDGVIEENNLSTLQERMTGLKIIDYDKVKENQKEIINDFHAWVKSLSKVRSFLHWGGNEKKLIRDLGTSFDVLYSSFKPWLEKRGEKRNHHCKLIDGFEQIIGNKLLFVPHRAFEDALATLTIYIAITSYEGIV